MDLDAKMDDLFGAFANQSAEELRPLFAADFEGRQNGSRPSGFDDLIAILQASFWSTDLTYSYGNIRRVTAELTVVEQHDVTFVRPDGVQVVLDVCVIVRFNDQGLVSSIEEYADTARLAPLMT